MYIEYRKGKRQSVPVRFSYLLRNTDKSGCKHSFLRHSAARNGPGDRNVLAVRTSYCLPFSTKKVSMCWGSSAQILTIQNDLDLL